MLGAQLLTCVQTERQLGVDPGISFVAIQVKAWVYLQQ